MWWTSLLCFISSAKKEYNIGPICQMSFANLAGINNHLGQGVCTLSEGEDGGDRADDHDQDWEEKDGVQHGVSAGDTRNPPVADLQKLKFSPPSPSMIFNYRVHLVGFKALRSDFCLSRILERFLTTNFLCLIYWYWQSSHTGGSPVFFEQTSSHFW